MPLLPHLRDIFKVRIYGKDGSRGFGSPSAYAWITISSVSYDCKIIGNRLRAHAKLLDYARLVSCNVTPPIQLDDAIAGNALAQILVRRADDHSAHSLIRSRFQSGRG